MRWMIRASGVLLLFLFACASVRSEQDQRTASAPSVLISRQLAEARGLGPGGSIRLSTEPHGTTTGDFRIAGIYEPIPDPVRINATKHEVRLHLPDLLELTRDAADPLSTENVQAVTIALANGADPQAFSRQLAARHPMVTVQPVGPGADAGLFVVLERFHQAIALVTVIASTIFLLALSVMLVEERSETVGVLRLIGLSSRRILAQVFVEGLLIAVAGAVAGLAIAVASEGVINRFFQWRYDTALVFVRLTPGIAVRCLAIAVPLGVAGSVLASWALLRRRALRLVRR
jgi:putative ABC transport system permease protein